MSGLRARGVFFSNSHSLYPTLTTPNSATIATGHYAGDTGDFGNYLYTGYPLPLVGETQVPFLENDRVLGNLDEHFGGNFLQEETLISFAAKHGYNTAAIGKLGPILIQDAPEGNPINGLVPIPKTVIVDDSTGKTGGLPLDPRIAQALLDAHLPVVSPDRSNGAKLKTEKDNSFTGNNSISPDRSRKKSSCAKKTMNATLNTLSKKGRCQACFSQMLIPKSSPLACLACATGFPNGTGQTVSILPNALRRCL